LKLKVESSKLKVKEEEDIAHRRKREEKKGREALGAKVD
jgi:hypothetical protein